MRRLNRYGFNVKGSKCNILVITKRSKILKIQANRKMLPIVRIKFIVTHIY